MSKALMLSSTAYLHLYIVYTAHDIIIHIRSTNFVENFPQVFIGARTGSTAM
jgi:hypothetical protein